MARNNRGAIPAEITPPEVRYMDMQLVWKCGGCGYLKVREELAPASCPSCFAPREEFYLLTED